MRPDLRVATWAMALRMALAVVLLGAGASPGLAQSTIDDTWNPFKQPEKPPPRRKQAPPVDQADLQREQVPKARSRPIESSDLSPVMAPDASGLPLDLWAGLDTGELEKHLAALDLPPRSPALHQLWRRMMLSSATAPRGAPSPDHFLALRLEALYRSGMLAEMGEAVGKSGAQNPLAGILLARKDIGAGERDAGCGAVRALAGAGLSGRLKGETQLLLGYCAAASGDAAGAGLAASMAREEGLTARAGAWHPRRRRQWRQDPAGFASARFPARLPVPAAGWRRGRPADRGARRAGTAGRAGDWRGKRQAADGGRRGGAALERTAARSRRRASTSAWRGDPPQRATTGQEKAADPLQRRAQAFAAIEATQNPDQKARLIRAFLADASWSRPPRADRAHAGATACGAVAVAVDGHARRAGDRDRAGGGRHRGGAALGGDIGEPAALAGADRSGRSGGAAATKSAGLRYMDELAARGRLGRRRAAPAGYRARCARHRRAARDLGSGRPHRRSRRPAICRRPACWPSWPPWPSSRSAGRTVAARRCARSGPTAPDGANVLVLGDAVRALKRAGLEADARRLALEALLPVWPRIASLKAMAHGIAAMGQRQLLGQFLEMLAAERGAARQHACQAYRRDLDDFLAFLAAHGRTLAAAAAADISAYLREPVRRAACRRHHAPGASPPSASCSSSSPREGVVAENPAYGVAGSEEAPPAAQDAVGRPRSIA